MIQSYNLDCQSWIHWYCSTIFIVDLEQLWSKHPSKQNSCLNSTLETLEKGVKYVQS